MHHPVVRVAHITKMCDQQTRYFRMDCYLLFISFPFHAANYPISDYQVIVMKPTNPCFKTDCIHVLVMTILFCIFPYILDEMINRKPSCIYYQILLN